MIAFRLTLLIGFLLTCSITQPLLYSQTVTDEWVNLQKEKATDRRAMFGNLGGDESGVLGFSEYAEFYKRSGGGYYLNAFGFRFYDLLKPTSTGFAVFMVYAGALMYFGLGGGAFKASSRDPKAIVDLSIHSLLVLVCFQGAPYIYATAQAAKSIGPALIISAVESNVSDSLTDAMLKARLAGPWSSAPMFAIGDGVKGGLEQRGILLHDKGQVAAMQLYNEYAAAVNAQLNQLDPANPPEPLLVLANMSPHLDTFDGQRVDLSGYNFKPGKTIDEFIADRGITLPAEYRGGHSAAEVNALQQAALQSEWQGLLENEVPRMIRLYASPLMVGKPLPGGYPLADRLFGASTSLGSELRKYYDDLRAGRIREKDVEQITADIREAAFKETILFVDFAIALQAKHHAYPAIRAYITSQYKPAESGSMIGRFVSRVVSLGQDVYHWAENKKAGWWSDLQSWAVERAVNTAGVGLVLWFADMALEVTIEACVLVIAIISPFLFVASLRHAFICQINNLITIVLTSASLLFLFLLWEGVLTAIAMRMYHYSSTDGIGSAGLHALGTLAVIDPLTMLWMWVLKIVGFILCAFNARAIAVKILKGEAFIGRMIGMAGTAMGAGAIAGVGTIMAGAALATGAAAVPLSMGVGKAAAGGAAATGGGAGAAGASGGGALASKIGGMGANAGNVAASGGLPGSGTGAASAASPIPTTDAANLPPLPRLAGESSASKQGRVTAATRTHAVRPRTDARNSEPSARDKMHEPAHDRFDVRFATQSPDGARPSELRQSRPAAQRLPASPAPAASAPPLSEAPPAGGGQTRAKIARATQVAMKVGGATARVLRPAVREVYYASTSGGELKNYMARRADPTPPDMTPPPLLRRKASNSVDSVRDPNQA